MSVIFRVAGALGLISACMTQTSRQVTAEPATNVPGLSLSVAPIVDVGSHATFTLSAQHWPAPGTAAVRFVSPNHGFTGGMLWDVRCRCFRLAVALGKRVHPLEPAHAWATVRFASGIASAATTFQIRGLAPGGHSYALGGKPLLRGWVSDPRPVSGQEQHYCAWVHASDALGFAGVPVRIIVRYRPKAQILRPGRTDKNGVACARHTIDGAPAGATIAVDIYARALHTRTQFTPRS